MPANLTYTQIETRVMNQLRIPTSNATEQTKIAALINEVYRDIWVKQDWWFLEKRGVINTTDNYSTGTLTVTNGLTSGTFNTAPGAALGSFAGRVLIITGDTTDNLAVYRISTHVAGAGAFTFDAAFTGTTSTTAAFNVYQDTYSLPTDVGKLIWVKRYGRDFGVEQIQPRDMMLLKTSDTTVGKPNVCCVLDFSTTGDPTTARQLVVHPYPDNTYRMELLYKQQLNTELSGTTQPLLPDEYRQIIIYGALARGYPIFLSDAERGQYFQQLFNDMLNLMASAHREYSQQRPQMSVRDQDRRRFPPRRVGKVSLGSLFDVWPSEP